MRMPEPLECSATEDDDTARRVFRQRKASASLVAFLVGDRGADAAAAVRATWTLARGAGLADDALVAALFDAVDRRAP